MSGTTSDRPLMGEEWTRHVMAENQRIVEEANRLSGRGGRPRPGGWLDQTEEQANDTWDYEAHREANEQTAGETGVDPVTGKQVPSQWLLRTVAQITDETPMDRRFLQPPPKSEVELAFARKSAADAARREAEDETRRKPNHLVGQFERVRAEDQRRLRAAAAARDEATDAVIADAYEEALDAGVGRPPRVHAVDGEPRWATALRRNRVEERALARLVPHVVRRPGEDEWSFRSRQRREAMADEVVDDGGGDDDAGGWHWLADGGGDVA